MFPRSPAPRRILFATTLGALAVALAGWTHHVPVPVKVGQQTVDPARLPFACITIGTAGVAVPIETVTVENLDTHEDFTARLGKFNNQHRDYPYGGDDKQRALSMAILQLPAGRYRLKTVEFTPEGSGGVNTLTCNLPDLVFYSFTVKPGCVNYVGSVILNGHWADAKQVDDKGTGEYEARIRGGFEVEHTEQRDRRWAEKEIPCLASLPVQTASFGGDPVRLPPSILNNDRAPKPLLLPMPAYPEKLRNKHVSGKVVVEFDVDTDGLVQNPKILSSPSDDLSVAVLLATVGWRFEPAMVNGKPVTRRVQLPIGFTPDAPH